MIWGFRVFATVCVLQGSALLVFGGGAGMELVWLLVGLVAIPFSFEKLYKRFFKSKVLKIFFALGTSVFIGVECCIVWSGFNSVPKEESDFIIVLGAHVKEYTPSMVLLYRLEAACTYLKAHPHTQAVLSGGQGEDEIVSEAEAMKTYLIEKGIGEDRLILEDESTSTSENLKYSFELIDAINKEAKVSIVTNYFHVLRARMIAKDLGKEVGGIGAKTFVYLIPNYYFREFFAVVKEVIM